MNVNKTAVWTFAAAAAIYILSLFCFASALPDRVASHFGNGGVANGWMSREEYLITMLLTGPVLAMGICALCFVCRYLPPSLFNTPHPEYWRSPEHYPEACQYLFVQSIWLGAMLMLWLAGMNYLTLRANAATPPRLDETQVWILTGVFLAATVVWCIRLYRHYQRVPE